MSLPFYWVDAFTHKVFGGNPAGVCPLESWLPDAELQAIARENNLSETAFFVPRGEDYELRWFTPELEVDLCGHATLASGKVVLDELRPGADSVHFHSRSGPLGLRRTVDGKFELDFPSQPGLPHDAPALSAALGAAPTELRRSVSYDMAVYATQAEVEALAPLEAALLDHDALAVIATAPGESEVDFVSRFFAPKAGIFEDPVTGSAHCVTTPYWAERLGKSELHARQLSARGGELWCTLAADRVLIAGHAVLYMSGTIHVPDVER